MEETLHGVPLYRELAGLEKWTARQADGHHHALLSSVGEAQAGRADALLIILTDEALMLHAGTVVDATLIGAPSSTT